ncbi:hypothetical protein C8R43DRAFT_69020 [Mycena crocata]|nr:hypothetical protein C8R43DRAFT_69020 [Mycena crocata]
MTTFTPCASWRTVLPASSASFACLRCKICTSQTFLNRTQILTPIFLHSYHAHQCHCEDFRLAFQLDPFQWNGLPSCQVSQTSTSSAQQRILYSSFSADWIGPGIKIFFRTCSHSHFWQSHASKMSLFDPYFVLPALSSRRRRVSGGEGRESDDEGTEIRPFEVFSDDDDVNSSGLPGMDDEKIELQSFRVVCPASEAGGSRSDL